VVPGMALPVTMAAISGLTTRAAPGSAVFDKPTISPASDPSIRLPGVNTVAAYAATMWSAGVADSEIVGTCKVRAGGLRRYTPCVL
jgi:hypothetical protein